MVLHDQLATGQYRSVRARTTPGSSRTTPDQAQEVHGFIRQLLKELHNQDVADIVRIQYGGSIKPDNIIDLMAQPDVDGGLVGGASLKSLPGAIDEKTWAKAKPLFQGAWQDAINSGKSLNEFFKNK